MSACKILTGVWIFLFEFTHIHTAGLCCKRVFDDIHPRNMCRIMYFQSGIGAQQQRLKLPDGRLVQVEGPDAEKSLVPCSRQSRVIGCSQILSIFSLTGCLHVFVISFGFLWSSTLHVLSRCFGTESAPYGSNMIQLQYTAVLFVGQIKSNRGTCLKLRLRWICWEIFFQGCISAKHLSIQWFLWLLWDSGSNRLLWSSTLPFRRMQKRPWKSWRRWWVKQKGNSIPSQLLGLQHVQHRILWAWKKIDKVQLVYIH